MKYKGYTLRFTGWKQKLERHEDEIVVFPEAGLVAQWVAWSDTRPWLYVCCPGDETNQGEYKSGEVFANMPNKWAEPQAEFENARFLADRLGDLQAEGLMRMLTLIDSWSM